MQMTMRRVAFRHVIQGLLALFGVFSTALAAVGQTGSTVAQGDRVITLTDTSPAAVGGVAVDRIGMIYVADFRETVWKITPDGRASVFATGLYGASGNAIDSKGNLLH